MYRSKRKAKSAAAGFAKRVTSASVYTVSGESKTKKDAKKGPDQKQKQDNRKDKIPSSPVESGKTHAGSDKSKNVMKNKKNNDLPDKGNNSAGKDNKKLMKAKVSIFNIKKETTIVISPNKQNQNASKELDKDTESLTLNNEKRDSSGKIVKQQSKGKDTLLPEKIVNTSGDSKYCKYLKPCLSAKIVIKEQEKNLCSVASGFQNKNIIESASDYNMKIDKSRKSSVSIVNNTRDKHMQDAEAKNNIQETFDQDQGGFPSEDVTRDRFLKMLGLVKATEIAEMRGKAGPSHGLHRLFGGKLRRKIKKKSPDGVHRILSITRGCVMSKYSNKSDSEGDSPSVTDKKNIVHVDQDRQKSLSPKVQRKFKTYCANKTPVISINKLHCKKEDENSDQKEPTLCKSSSFKENEPCRRVSKKLFTAAPKSPAKFDKISQQKKKSTNSVDAKSTNSQKNLSIITDPDLKPERQSLRQKIKYESMVPVWKRKQHINFNDFRITKKDIKLKEKQERDRKMRREQLENKKTEKSTEKPATETMVSECKVTKSTDVDETKSAPSPKTVTKVMKRHYSLKSPTNGHTIKKLKDVDKEQDLLCYESLPDELDGYQRFHSEEDILMLFPHSETKTVPSLQRSRSLPRIDSCDLTFDPLKISKYSAANVISTNDILLSPRKERKKNPDMPKLDLVEISPQKYRNEDIPATPPKLSKIDTVDNIECSEAITTSNAGFKESSPCGAKDDGRESVGTEDNECMSLECSEDMDFVEEVVIGNVLKESNDFSDDLTSYGSAFSNSENRERIGPRSIDLSATQQNDGAVSPDSLSLKPIDNYSFKDYECIIPHMCQVCWINDHMYCKNMKRVARDLPPCGGCLHYIPCYHYRMIQDNSNYSHRWGQNGRCVPQNIKVDDKNNLMLEPTEQGLYKYSDDNKEIRMHLHERRNRKRKAKDTMETVDKEEGKDDVNISEVFMTEECESAETQDGEFVAENPVAEDVEDFSCQNIEQLDGSSISNSDLNVHKNDESIDSNNASETLITNDNCKVRTKEDEANCVLLQSVLSPDVRLPCEGETVALSQGKTITLLCSKAGFSDSHDIEQPTSSSHVEDSIEKNKMDTDITVSATTSLGDSAQNDVHSSSLKEASNNKKSKKKKKGNKNCPIMNSLLIRVLPASSTDSAALKGKSTGSKSKVIAIKVQHSTNATDHSARAEMGAAEEEVIVTVPIKAKTAKRIKEVARMGRPEMSALLKNMHIAVISALAGHHSDLAGIDLTKLAKEVDTLSKNPPLKSEASSSCSSLQQETTVETSTTQDQTSQADVDVTPLELCTEICNGKNIEPSQIDDVNIKDVPEHYPNLRKTLIHSIKHDGQRFIFPMPGVTTSSTKIDFTTKDLALCDSEVLGYLKV